MIKFAFTSLWLVFSGLCVQAQNQIASDFNSDGDSWMADQGVSTVASAITYQATGGNPSGYVSFTTTSGSAQYYALAPAKFTGDLSASYNKTFSFDLNTTVAGSDNSLGDVILTNSAAGITIYYQLPAKPAAGTWTTYSVPVNEASWKYGCPTCSAVTQVQMKQVLQNVTAIHVRMKYLATPGAYIGELDNFVVNLATIGAAPTITSFTPLFGLPGTTLTISGTNFSTIPNQNVVYFNGVGAAVISANASGTQLTVKSPSMAPYGPVTVTNLATGQQASSTQNFNPLFNNNNDFGGRIIPSSMSIGNKTVLPMSAAPYNRFGNMDKGDLDGDGWVDLVVTETGTSKIFAYRNLGAGGVVSAASFSPQILLPSMGAGTSLSEVMVRDIDGDGKADVAASMSSSAGLAYFAVYRNTSTPGTISFDAPLLFGYPYSNPGITASGDLDGDGRIDLLASTGTSPGALWACRNLSTPGSIDFAYGVSLGGNSGYNDLDVKDLNNDGKPEIIASGYNAAAFTVYQNTSVSGSLSFTKFDIATTQAAAQFTVADLDADNKPDIVWSGYAYNTLYIFKNGFNGTTLDVSSFGSEIKITNTVSDITAVAVGDMNGDNRPDVVAIGYSDMGIFQNNTTAGSITSTSFAKSVVFEGALGGEAIYASGPTLADLDGDNKPEIAMVYTNNVSTANKAVFIFHNECYPAPVITSLSSYTPVGNTSYTVNGNYLNTGGDKPDVRTDGELSGSSDVTNTLLHTVAPIGGSTYRMGVTLHGLSAWSPLPLFNSFSSSGVISASSFPASVDYPLATPTLYDGLAVADFDDDGNPDVIVSDVVSGFSVAKLYKNNLASSGQPLTTTTFGTVTNSIGSILHARADDFDGDRRIDLMVNGTIVQNTGGPTLPLTFTTGSSPVSSATRILTQHDLNNDGKSDVIATTGGNQIDIYENLSRKGSLAQSGSFYSFSTSPVLMNSGGTVTGVAAGDFDRDGWEDIAFGVASASGVISVVRNTGTTGNITLTQFSAPLTFPAATTPAYIVTADFDADGKLDLAVGNNTSTFVSVYLNTSTAGTISFSRKDIPSLTGAVGIDVSDIDGDTKTDIVVIHQPTFSTGAFSILKNTSTAGNISFAAHVDFSLPGVPVSLALADLNLDTKPDILISRNVAPASAGGMLSIFENKIALSSLKIDVQPVAVYTVCDGGKPVFKTAASGTTNITYQWQKLDVASGTFLDVTNINGYSNASTASLTVNTTGNFGAGQYRCKVSGDLSSPIYTNTVSLTISPVASAPSAGNVSRCGAGSVALMASGAAPGQHYIWYDDHGAIPGQTQSTYITPVLSASTSYDVTISNVSCESARTTVVVTITPGPCGTLPGNQPPVIAAYTTQARIGSDVQIDLSMLVSDPDNNADLSTLAVIHQPLSGAVAAISASHILDVQYSGIEFAGSDKMTIQVCDAANACTQQDVIIDVAAGVTVYNAVSPNGDGKNDFLYIQYIDVLPSTKENRVFIYNRWGDEIYSVSNYNNTTNRFDGFKSDGKPYPSGTYFYRIVFSGDTKGLTGYFDIHY